MEKILKELHWDEDLEDQQLKLFVIVNIPPGAPDKTTANLIGPVLLNRAIREAVQIIVADGPYSHRFPLS